MYLRTCLSDNLAYITVCILPVLYKQKQQLSHSLGLNKMDIKHKKHVKYCQQIGADTWKILLVSFIDQKNLFYVLEG